MKFINFFHYSIKAMLSRKIAHQTHPLVYGCKQLCWSLCGFRLTWDWWVMNWLMNGQDRRLRALRGLVDLSILFFQM
jgi:hypothetical protein